MSESPENKMPDYEVAEGTKLVPEARKHIRKRVVHYHFLARPANRAACPEKLMRRKFVTDMHHGEDILYEYILPKGGRNVYRIWVFTREKYACETCHKSEHVYFNIQPTGVYVRCRWCEITVGPQQQINQITNRSVAMLIHESFVTLEEAKRIIARTGQRPPWAKKAMRRPASTRERREI